ncbi:hypothetical protein [Streptomyces tanashiensis]
MSTPRAPDTATSYPLAPPAPPALRKRRSAWYAGSAAAVALLLPDGAGPDGNSAGGTNGGDRPSSPATATGTTTKPTPGGSSRITIGIKFDQPGLGPRKPDGTYALRADSTGSTYTQCMTALSSGEVDAVTTDDALPAGYATRGGPEGRFELAGFRLTEERYGIGLPKGSALRAKAQSALARMVTDGSWHKAVEKNLPLLRTDPPPFTD